MNSVFAAMFLTGLAGGFGHCIGMCGPLVAAFALGEEDKGWGRHLLFHLGRITTYSILGGVAGLTGSFLMLAASIGTLQTAVQVITGISIVLMGLLNADWLPLKMKPGSCRPAFPVTGKVIRFFEGPVSTGSYYPLGVVFGFLPCGLSYTALLSAARASMDIGNRFSALLTGLCMMLLFGTGTVPALLFVGKAAHSVGGKLRKQLYGIASLIMIVTGLTFIVSALK
ncbi:MAG: sulfite exporter TauE/SafE family protein [Chlorobiaceae bacterium]|nr:sulfite exporter TauE/SafE family protein [Chlorobiaceae bacterium]